MGSAVKSVNSCAQADQQQSRAEQSLPLPNSLLVFVGQAVTDVGSMVNTCQKVTWQLRRNGANGGCEFQTLQPGP